MTSFNVKHRQLSLGERDATTGQYLKSYVDSVIRMVILPASASVMHTGAGFYARVDAVGYTDINVAEGDQITDLNDRSYNVLSCTPVKIGDQTVYYEVALSGYRPDENADYVASCVVFIMATDGGVTDPIEGMYVYNFGDEVTVEATADSGYDFIRFERDNGVQSTDNPYTFTVGRTMAVMAEFRACNLPPVRSGIMSIDAGFANPEIREEAAVYGHDVRNTISEEASVSDALVSESISESVEVTWEEGSEPMKQIVCWRSGANLAGGTTKYIKPTIYGAGEGVETAMKTPDGSIEFPKDTGNITYVGAFLDQAPGAGEDVTVTLMRSSIATEISFVISGAADTTGYDTGTVLAVAGYYFDLRVVSSGGSAATKITAYAWWEET